MDLPEPPTHDAKVEALTALAQMDLEAAAAYSIGLEALSSPELRAAIERFRDDHLRHVEALGRVLEGLGAAAVRPDESTVAESALTALAHAAGQLGPKAALLAMIGNEQLTNSTYRGLLELPWDEEVRELLQRNFVDERNHLMWLQQQVQAIEVDQMPVSPS
jgi:rubrerythrin